MTQNRRLGSYAIIGMSNREMPFPYASFTFLTRGTFHKAEVCWLINESRRYFTLWESVHAHAHARSRTHTFSASNPPSSVFLSLKSKQAAAAENTAKTVWLPFSCGSGEESSENRGGSICWEFDTLLLTQALCALGVHTETHSTGDKAAG